MSDIDIALAIDASGVQAGADQVNTIFDAIVAGAGRAMQALDDISASFGRIGSASSQSASATQTAANSQTASFDRLNSSITTLNANLVRMMQANQAFSQGQSQQAASQAQVASATDKYAASLASLDARLGLITKSDAAYAQIQAQLNQLLAQGAISQDQYATRIERANDLMDQGKLAAQGHAAGLAGISRELVVMGREVVSGDFSRIPGSFLVLTNRMGGLSLGTLGLVAGFGALTAAMADLGMPAGGLDLETALALLPLGGGLGERFAAGFASFERAQNLRGTLHPFAANNALVNPQQPPEAIVRITELLRAAARSFDEAIEAGRRAVDRG